MFDALNRSIQGVNCTKNTLVFEVKEVIKQKRPAELSSWSAGRRLLPGERERAGLVGLFVVDVVERFLDLLAGAEAQLVAFDIA